MTDTNKTTAANAAIDAVERYAKTGGVSPESVWRPLYKAASATLGMTHRDALSAFTKARYDLQASDGGGDG